MGKRGPKPTPTPILKLRQSWRGKQRGAGPKLDQKCPPCPKRFITHQKTDDGEAVRQVAKRTWDRLAKPLWQAGLLVDSYREPFEALCDSYARYVLACAKCDAEGGMVQNSSTGTLMQNPWVSIRNKMWEQVYKAAAAFGLTPADVSGVRSMEKPTAENAKQQFFKRA